MLSRTNGQNITNAASYSAADAIPLKLCMSPRAAALEPMHVQWIPTNKCNLSCDFCACSARDRSHEMDMESAYDVIENLAAMGCKAATITGGGEPICHLRLPDMIEEFVDNEISVGLVTNGTLLGRLPPETLDLLTWCRVSHADNREFGSAYQDRLRHAMQADTDWAFSYVVGASPRIDTIRRIVEFANDTECTHVRLVADLCQVERVNLDAIRESLAGRDSQVIYQPRNTPEPGGDCRICYVKPVIGPDWSIGPCCGYQYATEPPAYDLPEHMNMGDARDLLSVWDGKRDARDFGCVRCYYMHYNRVLDAMSHDVAHAEFI